MQDWLATELRGLDLGDKRLNERQGILLNKLAANPNASLPGSTCSWAELLAAYRFCDNQRVTSEKVLSPHRAATIERIRCHAVVLIPQDTTELVLDRDPESGFGKLTSTIGLLDHIQIAVTPLGQHLGVTRCHLWARPMENPHKETHNRDRPIEEKESMRWLDGYRDACLIAQQAPGTLIVSLSDREGDVYECLLEGATPERGKTAEWIVRSAQNRILNPTEESASQAKKLRAAASELPVVGTGTIKIPARANQPARVARVEYRAGCLTLKAPPRKEDKLPDIIVNVAFVVEVDPPANVEPLNWLLLTSLSIDTLQDVLRVVEYYSSRWQIEVFFKVLKQGCTVERLQLQEARRMEVCVSLYCIVAWRILHVTMLGRDCPEISCEAVFSTAEWQSTCAVVTKSAPPQAPPMLGDFLKFVAALGGHLGRAHDGPPGPEIIWRGMRRVFDFAIAWETRTANAKPTTGDGCV